MPTGQAPDLRRSSVPLSANAFAAVVRMGALISKGMPVFAEFDDRQLYELRQYLRVQAASLRAVK
jgi:quinohemoprotein ethanol dehydrogenase